MKLLGFYWTRNAMACINEQGRVMRQLQGFRVLCFLQDSSVRSAQSAIYALISPVIISLNLVSVLLPEENTVFKTTDPIQDFKSM